MKKHFLLFLICTSLTATTLRVPDLSQESIEGLRAYQSNNPGPLTIKVEGEKSLFQTVFEWGEIFLGKGNSPTEAVNELGLLKPILQWVVGGTVMSYGTGFYLIYRAYTLLRVVGSWTFAASQQNEDEMVLYIRKMQTKTLQKKSLQEIKKEKVILGQYLKVHTLLCRWKIRKLFLYNQASHRSIVKSYNRLCVLEKKLCEMYK